MLKLPRFMDDSLKINFKCKYSTSSQSSLSKNQFKLNENLIRQLKKQTYLSAEQKVVPKLRISNERGPQTINYPLSF